MSEAERSGGQGGDERADLRRLDACLTLIEDALERGEETVSVDLALKVSLEVPQVRPGMPGFEALELVFQAQEAYLPARQHELPVAPRVALVPVLPHDQVAWVSGGETMQLDEVGARDLTNRIRSATRHLCLLLLEAHTRRAWSALGYRTWEQYVQEEFSISRSRSYELIDQGRVIQSIRAAAGMCGVPDISAYAALQVKSNLARLISLVRERTAGLPQEQIGAVISAAVRELRDRLAHERSANTSIQLQALPPVDEAVAASDVRQRQVRRLVDAVHSLAHMPPADRTVEAILGEGPVRMVDAEGALLWLSNFVNYWKSKQSVVGTDQADARTAS